MPPGLTLHQQLEIFGREELVRASGGDQRIIKRIDAAQAAMAEAVEDATQYLHHGFCRTALPHSRPDRDDDHWHRVNGRYHLLIEPGSIIDNGVPRRVGVPYGAKARLVLLYIQSTAMKGHSNVVPLGRSLSDWMHRMGLAVTGGPKGTIRPLKEQILRLSRARFSMHWTDQSGTSVAIADRCVADGVVLWTADPAVAWVEELHLNQGFVDHLRCHYRQLSDNAIKYLSGNCLKLDLYCWLADRLPRIEKTQPIGWAGLADQLGSDYGQSNDLAVRIRSALPDVLAVYPEARVDVVRHGIRLHYSPPPVPEKGRRS